MSDTPNSLSDQERAELEQLRAEKRRREADAQAERERAELRELRAEQEAHERHRASLEREERARKRMEPGDDLSMPLAQKVVLAICAMLLVCGVFYVVLAPK
ncbi:hypothetical protein AAK967_03825 [Atopobiaceae bacterium 24-176]